MNKNTIKNLFLGKYYNTGDYNAFEVLRDNLENLKDYELKKDLEIILPILFYLNYLVIEYQNGTENEKINNILEKYNIEDFYIETKGELWNILNISEKDCKKYN